MVFFARRVWFVAATAAVLVAGCGGSSTHKSVRAIARVEPTSTSDPYCYGVEKPEVPEPGFNPMTASDAELHSHDFPPRPQEARELRVWENYARKYMAGKVILCTGPYHGPKVTGFAG